MATSRQIKTAKDNGILIPVRTALQAEAAGIPYYVACAFLMQESGGGQHVYGHDRNANGSKRIFWGHGEVTQCNYEAYLKEVGRSGERQGVGVMQLTWSGYQTPDIWRINVNLRKGFDILAEYHAANPTWSEERRWHYAALRYNGKELYADQMDGRFEFWRRLLGETP